MKDLKAWALEHGTTADAELLGNLRHLLNPVIGRLLSDHVIYRPQADMLADRLYLALALVDKELGEEKS